MTRMKLSPETEELRRQMVGHIREAASVVAAAAGEPTPLDRARILASARQAAARAKADACWVVAMNGWMRENARLAVFAKCTTRQTRGGKEA